MTTSDGVLDLSSTGAGSSSSVGVIDHTLDDKSSNKRKFEVITGEEG